MKLRIFKEAIEISADAEALSPASPGGCLTENTPYNTC